MDDIQIKRLSEQITKRRVGMGIREAAREVGISHATLSRVENGKIPDLETFGKICEWLGEDPVAYLGISIPQNSNNTAQVHFKKGATIRPDSAQALGEMILLAQKAFLEEELES